MSEIVVRDGHARGCRARVIRCHGRLDPTADLGVGQGAVKVVQSGLERWHRGANESECGLVKGEAECPAGVPCRVVCDIEDLVHKVETCDAINYGAEAN